MGTVQATWCLLKLGFVQCTRKVITPNILPMEHLYVPVVTYIKRLDELPGESSVIIEPSISSKIVILYFYPVTL